MATNALYSGSFDPPTLGHAWIIEQGSLLFEHLFIGIGTNPNKKPLFTALERKTLIEKMIEKRGINNATVHIIENKFLINEAEHLGAKFIIRGIRNTTDFTYEQSILSINEKINPNIRTTFLIPPMDLTQVSSSVVKTLIGFENWDRIACQYIDEHVLFALRQKMLN